MSSRTKEIIIENMFYGAFPERRKGQEVLGKTSGITPEIEKEIVEFCTSWGDCRNLKFKRSLNQFPLKSKSSDGENLIAVVKVVNSGRDSMGREGNLARHALILKESDYHWLDYNPFTLESLGVFLSVWSPGRDFDTITLQPSKIPQTDYSDIPQKQLKQLGEYLGIILSGGEIYLFMNNHLPPAEDIIYYAMKLLPLNIKSKLSLTTFAFRKNLNYQIGCYYRQSNTQPDPLKVKYETVGEIEKESAKFVEILFTDLKTEKYARVMGLLANIYPPV